MVRNIKMNWGVRRWIRRHERLHGWGAVVIRAHTRYLTLTDTAQPIVVATVYGTAHCECGESKPAYVRSVYGVDPACVPA